KVGHRFANAMAKKPRSLIGNANRAVDLMCAHAFLRRVHQVEHQNPLVERDMAVFHDRANSDREGAAALIAPKDAGPRRLASELGDFARVSISAMTANGAIR